MTKLIFISDTHGQHEHLKIAPCDILVHAGDFSNDTGQKEMREFCNWLKNQPAKHKVLIAGNHDRQLEQWPGPAQLMIKELCPSCTYLQDSGATIMGIKFWGSPYTPEFFNWAFNCKRGGELKRHWDMIPDDTDVLVTHGPPQEILDKAPGNLAVGCEELRKALDRVKPKVHAFGHIHRSYGKASLWHNDHEMTELLNCSFVNEDYKPRNLPHVLEL